MREILDRIAATVGKLDTAAVAVTTSGARYFLRQMVEPSNLNLQFVSHNEVPAGTKVMSLGVIR
jgi:flagellar biosynthesis component FlhA